MHDRIDTILETRPISRAQGREIGRSRENRSIGAFQLGSGSKRISLIGGCHADEPVGPRMLRHLVAYLSSLRSDDPLLVQYQWWIVPHINPDGEQRNRAWLGDDDRAYDIVEYLTGVVRELPGEDIEFGFPRDARDEGTRPENRALWQWWRTSAAPFVLHISFHGIAFAAGPWFLIEEAWKDRCELLKERCATRVGRMGYTLHDVERDGEKGFFRLGPGFCTRPDSRRMRQHFIDLGDPETADLVRPSSMEAIRALGGDPLTLVSEMPLFITRGVGNTLGPPDPVAVEWKVRIEDWRTRLHGDSPPEDVRTEARTHGLTPMPVRDQMILQLEMLAAGLEQLAPDSRSGSSPTTR